MNARSSTALRFVFVATVLFAARVLLLPASGAPPPVTLLVSNPLSNRVYAVIWDGQRASVVPQAKLNFPAGIATRPALPDGRPARRFVVSNGNPTLGKSVVAFYNGSTASPYVGNLGDVYGLAADSEGMLYVAEYAQHRVRRITTEGVVENFAANVGSPYGLAVDALDRIYVTDQSAGRLVRIERDGTFKPLAGGLGLPHGIALDARGNAFVADFGGIVWRVRPDGSKSVFKPVAGGPTGLAFDAAGWLYVGSFQTGAIHAISPGGDLQLLATVPGEASFLSAFPALVLPLGPLRFERTGDTVTLGWDEPLILQSATRLDEIFTDVEGAVSPLTVSDAEAESRFFRLRK